MNWIMPNLWVFQKERNNPRNILVRSETLDQKAIRVDLRESIVGFDVFVTDDKRIVNK